ncbi:MAG: Ig-like domain-containing protein [Chromatiales bacterium]|nr:Ig-like domain-containing protein [Chromatiales bacterium]
MTRKIHRIGFIILGWVLLSGDAFISCSSDPGNLGSSNSRPIASDGFYTTSVSNSVVGFMQATDPDGDDLTYRITAVPQLGSLQNVDFSSGQFTYVPRDAGTDSFSFRASDGRLESNTGVVTIRVDSEATAKSSSAALVDLQRDPLVPDSLLILWGDSAGTLQRISRRAASAPVTLASGVRSFTTDPLRPGSMRVLAADGRLLTSVDGGTTWTDGEGIQMSSCPGGDLAALPPYAAQVLCLQSARHDGATRLRVGGDAAWPVLQASHDEGISWQPIVGPNLKFARIVTLRREPLIVSEWWLAISAATTSVLHTEDDGLSWTRVLDLPMADLTLVDCAPDTVCLMDAGRSQLWRYPIVR